MMIMMIITVEILSAFRLLFQGMTFINREQIALLESKFHFQIEYCHVPMVALFQIRNYADWFITDRLLAACCPCLDLCSLNKTLISSTFPCEEAVYCYKTVKKN